MMPYVAARYAARYAADTLYDAAPFACAAIFAAAATLWRDARLPLFRLFAAFACLL